jgi:hypothetical protein
MQRKTIKEMISFLKDLRERLQSRSIYKEEYRQIDRLLKLLEKENISKNTANTKKRQPVGKGYECRKEKRNMRKIAELAKKIYEFLKQFVG